MKTPRLILMTGLSLLALASSTAYAFALMVAPAPIPQRVLTSDAVVLGKVTSIEKKPISAPRYPGDPMEGEYQIAVVKIDRALAGAKGLTHIRVGFIPPAPVQVNPQVPIQPGQAIRPVLPIRRIPQVTLTEGQEVCLFLVQHHKGPFYIAPNYFDLINTKGNPGFKKELEQIEQTVKLMADPMTSLTSKNPQERYLTAALLLTRYRTPQRYARNPKQEPIDARESKLILTALADAEWTNRGQDPVMAQMNPQSMFYRLGLTPQDGFVRPKNFKEFPDAAKKWLRANASTYRIKRYVAESSDK